MDEPPPFPEDQREDKEVVKKWKRAAAKVHSANRKNLGKRLQVAQVAAVARRFVGRPIWFPHQMDFRGRLYCLPVGLNPQGPDYAKALLLFDRAYPIQDDRALGWLMITGANRFGVDPIHFGAIIVTNVSIGMAAPPIGYCLFIGMAISGLSLARISRAIWPQILCMLVVLFLTTYVPGFALMFQPAGR